MVVSTSQELLGVDLYTGEARWKKNISNGGIREISYYGGSIFFLGYIVDFNPTTGGNSENDDGWGGHSEQAENQLIGLDAGTGNYLNNWSSVSTNQPGLSQVLIESGMLILRDKKNLYGYDAHPDAKEALRWSVGWQTIVSDTDSSPGPIGLGNDAVFFVAGNELLGVNVRSGQVRWRFQPSLDDLPQDKLHMPLVGDGLVIVTGNNAIYARDWITGAERWTYSTGVQAWNTPVVSWDGGCIFATSSTTGDVIGLTTESGEVFWQSSLEDLAREKNVAGQSGGFLRPIINTDVVEQDIESGHLKSENRVFLPARAGAVFILDVNVNNTKANLAINERFEVVVSDDVDEVNGIEFTPVIGNGCIYMVDARNDHQIVAKTYSPHRAAYFSGDGNSRLSIPVRSSFNFGLDDFSLEVWVRTTVGGDVITQSPSTSGTGFRLAVVNQPDGIIAENYGEGRIQFTIADEKAQVLLFVQSAATVVADGSWHHIAVARSGLDIDMYADGIHLPINKMIYQELVPAEERARLSKGVQYFPPELLSENIKIPAVGNSVEPICIGSYSPSDGAFVDDTAKDYSGMIADVRLWNRRLNAKQITNRMGKLLTGQEPGLIGDWPLNQPNPSDFKDLTTDQKLGLENTKGVLTKPTNLSFDDSLYPYLLNHVSPKWPYKERWMVRGEDAPKWSPAGAGEVVCFSTDRAFYAIDLIHGNRKWGRDMGNPSAPAADLSGCIVLEDTTVRSFELEKGVEQWFTDLSAQTNPTGERIPSSPIPVLMQQYAVVSADGINIYWLNKRTGAVIGYFQTPSSVGSSIYATKDQVYMIAGNTLYRFEQPSKDNGNTPLTPSARAVLQGSGDSSLCIDGGRLFVHNGEWVEILDAMTLQKPENLAWNPSSLTGQTITGMAASASANRLVITTKSSVLFWDFGSGKQVKAFDIPNISSPSVFAPVIYGKEVYCTVAGSTGSVAGGLWIFDLQSGDLRGQEEVESPPVGAPYVNSQTVFFGVNDNGASNHLDHEALHSVVVGNTLTLRRRKGTPAIEVPGIEPVFSGPDSEGSNAFNEGHFTLEVWINAESASAGDILYLPPGKDNAGFRLAVTDNSQIIAEHLKPNNATKFTSQPTKVADGRWHHVAAVFRVNDKSQQMAYLYLDGKPLTGVAHTPLTAVPEAQVDRKVAIGGDRASAFEGLIDDVRVWATWLHAAEISLRKNTKLTGAEPDLLAAWTFSTNAVHDASLNQLNVDETQDLDLWLSDLSFVQPNYPYITAKSVGVEIDEEIALEGNGATIKTAKYKTEISVRKADGSPRPSTVKIWASEPTDISSETNSGSQPVNATVFAEFTVGSDGKLELNLSCKDLEHSPVLWIWADFMYPNERFHVSPAVASQHHVIAPPPKLIAQSTMIQDYDYASGDSLGTHNGTPGDYTPNGNVDITTIRTTITAETNQGDSIPKQSLEIWANGHLTIEVGSKSYEINKENSAKFITDAAGTLTVVIHEKSSEVNLLGTPELQVRAGWMPRSQRVVISPAENQHQILSQVTGDQIIGDHQLEPGKPTQTLITKLKGDNPDAAKQQAPAIASTLRQMASVVNKPASVSNSAAGSAPGSSTIPQTGAELPNPDLHPADRVSTLHSLGHMGGDIPITPEYMPAKHFVFSLNGDGTCTYKLCHTEEDLDDHLQSLNLPASNELFGGVGYIGDDDPAGGWFNSLAGSISQAFHAVEHSVEKAWDRAQHFVVKTWDEIKEDVGQVIHQVEVVIADAANAIGKWVVKTVNDIANHIVAFLDKVWVALKDIYNFLRSLLDWKGILKVRDLIETSFNHFLDVLGTSAAETIPKNINAVFSTAKEQIAKGLGVQPAPFAGSLASQKDQLSGDGAAYVSHGKSSKGQWMQQKMQKHDNSTQKISYGAGDATLAAPFGGSFNTSKYGANIEEDFKRVIDDFLNILQQPGGITHLTVPEILQIVYDVINVSFDIAEDLILGVVSIASELIEFIKEVLNHEIHIPFISELYKLVSGHELTILDVVSLILAIPTHTILVIFDINIPEDAAAIVSSATFMENPDAAGSAQTSTKLFCILFIISSVVQGGVACITNVVEGIVKGDNPNLEEVEVPGWQKWLTVGYYFCAITSASFQFVARHLYFGWPSPTSSISKAFSYMPPVTVLCYLALIGLKLGPTGNSGGFLQSLKNSSIGRRREFVLTVMGLALLGVGVAGLATTDSGKPEYGENAVNTSSSIDIVCAFLLYQPICVATQTEVNVPLSAAGKGAISLVVYSICNTAIEGSMGIAKAE